MLGTISDALVIATFVITIEWGIAYHRKTRGGWWHTPMGRHLMAFAAAIALIVGGFVVGDVLQWFGYHEPTWFRALHVGTFAALPAVLIWRRVLLHRAQRAAEKGVDVPPPNEHTPESDEGN